MIFDKSCLGERTALPHQSQEFRLRRLLTAAFSLVVIPSALVALPVVSTPAAAPHPVAPSTVHVSVALPAGLTTAAAAGVNTLNSALRALTPAAGGAIAPSPPQDTANFRAAGLSWLHDSKITSLKALVRVRNNGQWGPWQEIENTDIGADNGRDVGLSPVRDGTDPLWVDHANGVQVQLESVTGGLPRDLRLDLVDPGTSAADSAPSGSSPLSSAAVARADTTQPAIFTRADWGADESLRLNACPNGPGSAGAIKVAFVHHTVTGNSYNPGDVPAIIRSIYAFHVQSEGWCDVGYNFLVDKFGRIWEGR
ncbi:MAG: hypothetical protein QOJ62_1361, partial [Actinomycetota bacterium]|nr:hypothetical protein [Actinomycetota bacterium]